MPERSRVFSALLTYWRNRRGMSQLDLALTADVSSRHISFLETGRSRPSEAMVLLLAAALDVPLRERNTMLREAGFEPAFDEPGLDALADPGIDHALTVMLRHHEPFPMLVVDGSYEVLRINGAARRMLEFCMGTIPERWNAMRAFFHPDWFRPHLADWESTARGVVARLQREVLRDPHDDRLAAVLAEVLAAPGVPDDWQRLDLSSGSEGTLDLRFEIGGQVLTFVVTMMAFHAPQNVTLDEIQIESYFPSDEATERACATFFGTPA